MITFPAILSTTSVLALLLIILIVPVTLIIFLVWLVRKLNAIEKKQEEILERLYKQ